MTTAVVALDGTKSTLVFVEEDGNVNNKVYSASAGRQCVSLLTDELSVSIVVNTG